MATPLRLSAIEPKPKRIHKSPKWSVAAHLKHRPDLQDEVEKILSYIEQGKILPSRYYRKSTETDTLLEKEGIMHLHLGKPDTNELLFLVQYDTYVVVLEVSDHFHFSTKPIGTRLTATHGSEIKKIEADQEKQQAQTTTDKNADIRARLKLPQKPIDANESAIPDMRKLINISKWLN